MKRNTFRRNPSHLSRLSAIAVLVTVQLTATTCAASADEPPLDDYALDSYSRTIPTRGKVPCPVVELVRYRGSVIRYARPLTVHPAFRDRLEKFEQVVKEVAIEVYGRAPTRIAHLGSYNCRRIRRFPHLISEHGLGNAIDVAGFDFGRAPRGSKLPEGVPAKLARSFEVRMADHWNSRGKIGSVHARFLRLLARRLIARPDIFRVLLGPAWPGHDDHFHFDCADYRLIAIFEEDAG